MLNQQRPQKKHEHNWKQHVHKHVVKKAFDKHELEIEPGLMIDFSQQDVGVTFDVIKKLADRIDNGFPVSELSVKPVKKGKFVVVNRWQGNNNMQCTVADTSAHLENYRTLDNYVTFGTTQVNIQDLLGSGHFRSVYDASVMYTEDEDTFYYAYGINAWKASGCGSFVVKVASPSNEYQNRMEWDVYQYAKTLGVHDIFPKMLCISDCSRYVLMEKVGILSHEGMSSSVERMVQNLMYKTFPIELLEDLHSANIGMNLYDSPVIIDMGFHSSGKTERMNDIKRGLDKLADKRKEQEN